MGDTLSSLMPASIMQRLLLALVFTISVSVAGCSSTPRGDSSQSQSASAPTDQTRIAAAVKIPAVSARKVMMVMTGPKTVTESKDWADFKREWQDTFTDHAKQAGVTFSLVDVPPATGTEDGTLLTVNVADYRIVTIGMRIMFGIMTGNAYIDAKISFTSLRDGTAFGEQQYNTTSSASGGVFSKVTPQQVDQIASNVFIDLKAAK